MSPPIPADKEVPAVIIVGAGLGGLMLGLLFERLGLPYHIFERAQEYRSLGSAMSLGATILPVFEQLGLLDEILKMSLPCHSADIYRENMKKIGSIDMKTWKTAVGYNNLLFPRPKLYALLLSHIPANKISLGKKVLRTEEKDGKVAIHCSDNTTYEGDILVGSDGAYSGVRQNLYKRLDEVGILPKADTENLAIGFVSMVGICEPKNPENYPQLKDKFSHFSQVVGKDTRSWGVCSLANNQVAWLLSFQLSVAEAKDQHFRNSEWGPESNGAMGKEFEDLPCPWGGRMGDIMNQTPKHLVSKVFLEEKLFETWFHGRTVLIGDAAHKMLPGAGLGAVNAMQDAVVLANSIYNMPDASPKSITAAFQSYYGQRYERSNIQFKGSNTWSKTLAGQTATERLVRNVILNYLPHWVQQKAFMNGFDYRPQIAWLPLAENRGTVRVLPQESNRVEGPEAA